MSFSFFPMASAIRSLLCWMRNGEESGILPLCDDGICYFYRYCCSALQPENVMEEMRERYVWVSRGYQEFWLSYDCSRLFGEDAKNGINQNPLLSYISSLFCYESEFEIECLFRVKKALHAVVLLHALVSAEMNDANPNNVSSTHRLAFEVHHSSSPASS